MKPLRIAFEHHWVKTRGKRARNDLQRHPTQPETYISDAANRHWVTWQAAQPKEQEPVAHVSSVQSGSPLMCGLSEWERQGLVSLYTTPYVATPRPQRPSRSDIKPLTIDQIASITIDRSKPDGIVAFVRAIEAAHDIHPTGFKE